MTRSRFVLAVITLQNYVSKAVVSLVVRLRRGASERGILGKCFKQTVSVDRKSDNIVRAHRLVFGLIAIHMVIRGIRLQTWMQVIVDVDV
jgi:hypothetical protein